MYWPCSKVFPHSSVFLKHGKYLLSSGLRFVLEPESAIWGHLIKKKLHSKQVSSKLGGVGYTGQI